MQAAYSCIVRFIAAMIQDKTDDLRRAYKLVKPAGVVGGIELLCTTFSEQVIKQGTAIAKDVAAKADPIPYIDGLLHFKRKYDSIVELAFQSDRVFVNEMHKCMDAVLNCEAATVKLMVRRPPNPTHPLTHSSIDNISLARC